MTARPRDPVDTPTTHEAQQPTYGFGRQSRGSRKGLGGDPPNAPVERHKHRRDETTAEQVRELLTKGGMSLAFILTTDDCRATYEELRAKGVEFTEEPTEHFYGVDCALRDPFGNHIRISQPAAEPYEVPPRGQ